MAGLVGTAGLPDLTPVAAEAGAAQGNPQPVYTWTGPEGGGEGLVRSYTPSDGGAPRLVAVAGGVPGANLGVWDTATGAFLGALQGPDHVVCSLVAYQRASDGRPRIAAGSEGGYLCTWDGDDFQLLHSIRAYREACPIHNLAVYQEPTSGRTRLVAG
jgi:WD40 repeat protein